jgi:predicted transcriptional regulator of viral defense system
MNTKSSLTLRFLESHEVFTLDEYLSTVDPSVTRRTRYLNLQNAIKRDQAYRLVRGLYASNLGVYRDRTPNALLVAAKAAPDAVLAYHSALEAHGVAHTPARTVYFTSRGKVRGFEARGYRFRRVPAPQPLLDQPDLSLTTQQRVGEALVSVTSRERTVVDCLWRLDLAGGLEELLRSVGGFATVSAEAAEAYTRRLGSPTLTARTGWLLSLMAREWRLSAEPLALMRCSLGRGTYWLRPRRPGVAYDFVAEWRLYVPAGDALGEWLRG